MTLPALLEAAGSARAIAHQGQEGRQEIKTEMPRVELYLPIDPIDSLCEVDKIALLKRLDSESRALDPRVEQVFVSLSGSHEVILVMGQDGALHHDVRPLVRLNVSVIVEHEGRREQGSYGGGGRTDYRYFSMAIAPQSTPGRQSAKP